MTCRRDHSRPPESVLHVVHFGGACCPAGRAPSRSGTRTKGAVPSFAIRLRLVIQSGGFGQSGHAVQRWPDVRVWLMLCVAALCCPVGEERPAAGIWPRFGCLRELSEKTGSAWQEGCPANRAATARVCLCGGVHWAEPGDGNVQRWWQMNHTARANKKGRMVFCDAVRNTIQPCPLPSETTGSFQTRHGCEAMPELVPDSLRGLPGNMCWRGDARAGSSH